ncbi:MAG: DUF86 domain-containing protein [Desulfobaccales bacterium]
MPKDYKVYIDDILESIGKIRLYIKGMTFEDFCCDPKTIDAVNRNLGVIGEATNRIPENIKNKYSGIEWYRIIGMRNILIHDYSNVDLEIIWDIIQNKLFIFEIQVKEILKD